MNITTSLRTLAIGTALLCAAAAHAATVNSVAGRLLATTAKYGQAATPITVPVWTLTDGDHTMLALCIEPLTAMSNRQNLTGTAFTGFDTKVERLYSEYYDTLATATTNTKLGFQLALWELYTDNGSLTNGLLAFGATGNSSANAKEVLGTAATMLATANDSAIAIDTHYTFTRWTAANSQTVVTALPVPEPATYAMLGAGLAIVGVAARRRRNPAR